jgi:hypothetical protein
MRHYMHLYIALPFTTLVINGHVHISSSSMWKLWALLFGQHVVAMLFTIVHKG